MKLTHIRNIVVVAQRGALQSSAQELGVSQNALVRSIQAVEQELGTTLFTRDKKSVLLTPVGEIFVRRAAAALLELDRATGEVGPNLGSFTSRVSIGMSASPHAAILPKVLMLFRRRFKEVPIRIVEGAFPKVEREVRDGILDFYVGPIWPHHRTGGLNIRKLYDVARVVVGRKGHPLARATSLAELADARWIATSRLELDTIFEQHHLPRPNIVVEVETGLSMLSAAAASDALLILSASWLPLIQRTDLLTPFRLNGTLDCPSIYVVMRPQVQPTPAAAYLHDLIVDAAGDMRSPPEGPARG